MASIPISFSVFVPIYNEEALLVPNVERMIRCFESAGALYEIVLGSNGSTDRTKELGQELERRYPQVHFIHHARRGPGLAFRAAIDQFQFENVFCLDMDLSVGPEFVLQATAYARDHDIVIGSKKMGIERRSLLRHWGSDLYIAAAQRLLDLPYHDYSLGAKGYRTGVLRRYRAFIGDDSFYVQRLVYAAAQDGLSIIEVPVDCSDNRRSRFNMAAEGFRRFGGLFHLWLVGRRKK